MSQRFLKVYPTIDDIGKTPIVVADEEGVNGVAVNFADVIDTETATEILTKTSKILGIKTLAGFNAIVTTAFTGGEEVTIVDVSGICTKKIWNNFTEEWV